MTLLLHKPYFVNLSSVHVVSKFPANQKYEPESALSSNPEASASSLCVCVTDFDLFFFCFLANRFFKRLKGYYFESISFENSTFYVFTFTIKQF